MNGQRIDKKPENILRYISFYSILNTKIESYLTGQDRQQRYNDITRITSEYIEGHNSNDQHHTDNQVKKRFILRHSGLCSNDAGWNVGGFIA